MPKTVQSYLDFAYIAARSRSLQRATSLLELSALCRMCEIYQASGNAFTVLCASEGSVWSHLQITARCRVQTSADMELLSPPTPFVKPVLSVLLSPVQSSRMGPLLRIRDRRHTNTQLNARNIVGPPGNMFTILHGFPNVWRQVDMLPPQLNPNFDFPGLPQCKPAPPRAHTGSSPSNKDPTACMRTCVQRPLSPPSSLVLSSARTSRGFENRSRLHILDRMRVDGRLRIRSPQYNPEYKVVG
ncbi:hypothetical protein B0H16DRAFT_1476828 [Mycena metata]|uniref:Uncharacterized protein n=1 Tax=Mycena metata TaxID=1033252 RepID=A0AAD7HAH6_9AGAR|nr:hypothetical protein B0H16DRAFT_1476828 [Mycena metata]